MKNIFFLAITILSLALIGCNGETGSIYGYVPENETIQVEWVNANGGFFHNNSILVITEKGDSVKANYLASGYFFGSNSIIYRDSYPPSKGKRVYVIMEEKGKDSYLIVKASLSPFEK